MGIFKSGVALDDVMKACSWKAHETFTSFNLKEVSLSNTEGNISLGPVVATQQSIICSLHGPWHALEASVIGVLLYRNLSNIDQNSRDPQPRCSVHFCVPLSAGPTSQMLMNHRW